MFRVEMLPAGEGDSLWVEYGTGTNVHRILIDGGVAATSAHLSEKLLALPEAERHLDLLVVTHIDSDHIGGIVELLADPQVVFTCGDVWFNGYKHVEEASDLLGALQGEQLTTLLQRRAFPWNKAFGGHAVVTLPNGEPVTRVLPGDLELTLLSPTPERLAALAGEWEKVVRAAGIVPGGGDPSYETENEADVPADLLGDELLDVEALSRRRFTPDAAKPNGSSIAFVAEFRGERCLFGADAFAPVLATALERLAVVESSATYRVDAVKLPHHGSRWNVSRELLEKLECKRFLVSTNGTRSKHPSKEAIARVITTCGPEVQLYFNYDSEQNRVWADPELSRTHQLGTVYPPDGTEGLTVSIRAE